MKVPVAPHPCQYLELLVLFFFFLNVMIHLFIYLWLCWVLVSVRGLSLVTASGGHSSSRCMGLSLSRSLLLRSTSSRRAGSVIVAHGPTCSVACGIFPDQGSNPCPLHWQADSQPLRPGKPPRTVSPFNFSLTGGGTVILHCGDFTGGPVVKIPCSQCRGPGFNPQSGN